MFHGISVLLNQPDPEVGSLAHASEWASRLRLPLRSLEWPVAAPNPPRGTGLRQFFRPFELFVFERELPTVFRARVLSAWRRSPQTAALICPRRWRPVTRILVLNQHACPGDGFLDAAAEVCQAFQAMPVLLTAAHSEAEARSREQSAEEAFARRRLTVDCDIMAGCDVATAVVHAARWRRCSHVFVEQRSLPRWRRWLGGDVVGALADLPDSPALVAVHETASAAPTAHKESSLNPVV